MGDNHKLISSLITVLYIHMHINSISYPCTNLLCILSISSEIFTLIGNQNWPSTYCTCCISLDKPCTMHSVKAFINAMPWIAEYRKMKNWSPVKFCASNVVLSFKFLGSLIIELSIILLVLNNPWHWRFHSNIKYEIWSLQWSQIFEFGIFSICIVQLWAKQTC